MQLIAETGEKIVFFWSPILFHKRDSTCISSKTHKGVMDGAFWIKCKLDVIQLEVSSFVALGKKAKGFCCRFVSGNVIVVLQKIVLHTLFLSININIPAFKRPNVCSFALQICPLVAESVSSMNQFLKTLNGKLLLMKPQQ